MDIELVALGLLGGLLTTVAGMGGGLLIVAALGGLRGPHEALAITTPALLVSNLHRGWMFRREIDRVVAKSFALGAVPGALLGGLIVPTLPAVVLSVILLGATMTTLARSMGWWRFDPSTGAIGGGGFGIGILAATAGGAGILTGPLFSSAGLRGARYVATISTAAVALHVGRVVGYGLGGLLELRQLESMAVLAVALVAGNLIGKRLRQGFDERTERVAELGTLVVCTILTVASL
jgi:uncharacterized protein